MFTNEADMEPKTVRIVNFFLYAKDDVELKKNNVLIFPSVSSR